MSNHDYCRQYASFNTQPPEGGWHCHAAQKRNIHCFNTQPPEGGWAATMAKRKNEFVSTHSRPKAAGTIANQSEAEMLVSTHSRPKAAGSKRRLAGIYGGNVSTHSRPKAAGNPFCSASFVSRFQHTAARRRLGHCWEHGDTSLLFQHTAARRRLGCFSPNLFTRFEVSTHSRPKAAGAGSR